MKIVLISIGTRGDMEPFMAIGEILKEKGHRVICALKIAGRMEKEGFSMDMYRSIVE